PEATALRFFDPTGRPGRRFGGASATDLRLVLLFVVARAINLYPIQIGPPGQPGGTTPSSPTRAVRTRCTVGSLKKLALPTGRRRRAIIGAGRRDTTVFR